MFIPDSICGQSLIGRKAASIVNMPSPQCLVIHSWFVKSPTAQLVQLESADSSTKMNGPKRGGSIHEPISTLKKTISNWVGTVNPTPVAASQTTSSCQNINMTINLWVCPKKMGKNIEKNTTPMVHHDFLKHVNFGAPTAWHQLWAKQEKAIYDNSFQAILGSVRSLRPFGRS